MHGVPDTQFDRYAVADDGGASGHFLDVTDDLSSLCRRCGLRVVDVAGQRINDVTGKGRTVLGGEGWPCVTLEVVSDDEFLAVARNDQVAADPHILAREQQMRVGNNDVAIRRVMLNESWFRIKRQSLPTQRNWGVVR